jgi:hypothetical protein
VVEQHVLELGGEVHLARAELGKRSNSSAGRVEAPCCTAPANPYFARDQGQRLERREVDLDLGDRAVG